jgi:hypothetical protein
LVPTHLRPSVALWSLAALCLASLGVATLYTIVAYDHESGWFIPLSLMSVSLLAVTSVVFAYKRARSFFLSSGMLTVLLALSLQTIDEIGLIGSWGVFFLCLYAIILGGKVLETGIAIDLKSKGWAGGDPKVARSIWREGLRITALLGATFLLAFLLLSITGLLAVSDLPLIFLALISVITLVVFYFIVSIDAPSER